MEKELENCLLAFEMIIDRKENELRKFAERTANSYSFFRGRFRFGRSSANCWEIHKKKKKKVESTLYVVLFPWTAEPITVFD
jgi:hypothetical protein